MAWRKLILCNAVAVAAALTSYAIVGLVQFPGIFRHPIAAAAIACVVYFSPPLLVASAIAMWRRHAAPLSIHVLLSILWWALLVYPWARKPWAYYGEFPWQGIVRLWLPILPPIVIAGVGFWAAYWAARRAV